MSECDSAGCDQEATSEYRHKYLPDYRDSRFVCEDCADWFSRRETWTFAGSV